MKYIIGFLIFCSYSFGWTYEDYIAQQKKNESVYKNQVERNYQTYIKQVNANIEKYSKIVGDLWGENEVKFSSKHEAIHYDEDFKLRDRIDFEKDILIIESVDAVDINKFNEKLKELRENKLSKIIKKDPIKSDINQPIQMNANANEMYEKILPKKYISKSDVTKRVDNGKVIYFVKIPFVKNSIKIRANIFMNDIDRYSKKYSIDKEYVLGVMHTESSFNPEAESKAYALGLMQIVPSTGGLDAYIELKGIRKIPTRAYLLNPTKNIELGCIYIHKIQNKYLKGIKDKKSLYYCTSTSYNAGIGTLKKSFLPKKYINKINLMSSDEVYKHLQKSFFTKEARNYVVKVAKYTSFWQKELKSNKTNF